MCIICVDFHKGKLTANEAMRNYWEMRDSIEPDHAEKLADEIQIAILKEAVASHQTAQASQYSPESAPASP